ncbi:hypothetical protein RHGRI_034060 [Rhododendron griersonianum]|uniref:Uncharacterized protein n=1 Tax=Rhododendron griersonianum TaxID=479676 RepID=A0AAV6HZ29_9ERIC|nr:hypothetical protein RHGRI_034060 [Rhododendron griersonianum]
MISQIHNGFPSSNMEYIPRNFEFSPLFLLDWLRKSSMPLSLPVRKGERWRNKNKDCLKALNDKQLLGICDLGANFDVYSKCASELKRSCFQATRFIEELISFKSDVLTMALGFVLSADGGKVKAKGTIFLSNIRMVFVANKPVGNFTGFDIPLVRK